LGLSGMEWFSTFHASTKSFCLTVSMMRLYKLSGHATIAGKSAGMTFLES
jgi:hypothetical protein